MATDMAVHGQTTKAMQELQEKVKIPSTLSHKKGDGAEYSNIVLERFQLT